MDINPSELVRQFAISPNKSYLPAPWHSLEMSGLYLATHPSLPALNVLTADGV